MKNKSPIFLLIFIFLFSLFPINFTFSQPADSPSPLYRFNQARTGQSTLPGPLPFEVKWSFKTGHRIHSTPALGSDGTIYFGSGDRQLYALDQSGEVKWSHDCLYGGAVDSSPAVTHSGTIYFGSGPLFYALDKDGKEINTSLTLVSPIVSSPLIAPDGNVYFGGSDGKLYALSPDLRKNLWTFQAGGAILSSPSRDQWGNLYFGSEDGCLYSLTPSGTLRWKFKTENGIESTPAVDVNGNVYFGSKDSSFYSLTISGQLRWSYKTEGSILSSPALGKEGAVYFGSWDTYLYALSTETGTILWSFKSDGPIDTSPTVDSQGRIFFGGQDKFFYCLDKDGTELGKLAFPSSFSRSSAVIGGDSTLYVGCENGRLYCLGLKPGAVLPTPTPSPTPTSTPSPFRLLPVVEGADLYPGGNFVFAINIHPLAQQEIRGTIETMHTPGLSVSLSLNDFILQGQDLTLLLTVDVPIDFPPGTYFLDVSGSSGTYIDKCSLQIVVKAPFFADVPSDFWASTAIGLLVDREIINGYPDGSFRPSNQVTRAEFAKMIVLTFGLSPVSSGTQTFPDVPLEHWAQPYVEAAVAYGLVQGYPDGTFRPEGKVTLAEAITLIVRGKRLELVAPPSNILLKEKGLTRPLSPEDWFYLYIGSAFQNGLLFLPDPNLVDLVSTGGAVAFNDPATRAQVSVLLSRVLS